MSRQRRRPAFWAVLLGTTVFLSIEPGLFLVILALGLSALALASIVLLVGSVLRALLLEPHRTAGTWTPGKRDAPIGN